MTHLYNFPISHVTMGFVSACWLMQHVDHLARLSISLSFCSGLFAVLTSSCRLGIVPPSQPISYQFFIVLFFCHLNIRQLNFNASLIYHLITIWLPDTSFHPLHLLNRGTKIFFLKKRWTIVEILWGWKWASTFFKSNIFT